MSNEQRPYMIYASFLEVYNEEVKDLLSSSGHHMETSENMMGNITLTTKKSPSSHLVIREDTNGEIYLAGCHEEEISNPEELFK